MLVKLSSSLLQQTTGGDHRDSHAQRGWHDDLSSRNVRRILVRGINVPLPPEAKKISKI